MRTTLVLRTYFSEIPGREVAWRRICWIVAVTGGIGLYLFWEPLRSTEFIELLQQYRHGAVDLIFRAFSFLGDEAFLMIFFSIMIWCVNKSLGFWTAVVLLLSGTGSNLIKDLTHLPRPEIAGVTQPGSYAFPSGHTLTAVTVWGYLAVRLKQSLFWVWAVIAVLMIGFSRLILGQHFVGDVLGGVVLGFVFLALFLWISAVGLEKGWFEKLSFPLLVLVTTALPVILFMILPGEDSPLLMGYAVGAGLGYLWEKEQLRVSVRGKWYQQVLKVVLGLVVLFAIVVGLSGILPSEEPVLRFIRYMLAGAWVTLLAPLVFVLLRLSAREAAFQDINC